MSAQSALRAVARRWRRWHTVRPMDAGDVLILAGLSVALAYAGTEWVACLIDLIDGGEW